MQLDVLVGQTADELQTTYQVCKTDDEQLVFVPRSGQGRVLTFSRMPADLLRECAHGETRQLLISRLMRDARTVRLVEVPFVPIRTGGAVELRSRNQEVVPGWYWRTPGSPSEFICFDEAGATVSLGKFAGYAALASVNRIDRRSLLVADVLGVIGETETVFPYKHGRWLVRGVSRSLGVAVVVRLVNKTVTVLHYSIARNDTGATRVLQIQTAPQKYLIVPGEQHHERRYYLAPASK